MERLVLFDIDCTLIDGHGAGKRAILRALREVYGVEGTLGDYSFHGRTDPAIVRDLVELWGNRPQEHGPLADDDTLQACLARYVELLDDEISGGHVETLSGVPELVAALAGDSRVLLGLLTGNVQAGAHLKLAATGLHHHFRVAAYGSDSAARTELPAIALSRAEEISGQTFTGKQIVIIGDTPADISCGVHLGVKAIAVATGRYSAQDLWRHKPDYVFESLNDWQSVFRAIVS